MTLNERPPGFTSITYRRTGGGLALLTFAVIAVAVAVFAVAVTTALLVVGATVAAVALVVRAVRYGFRSPGAPPAATGRQDDIIETTAVETVIEPSVEPDAGRERPQLRLVVQNDREQ